MKDQEKLKELLLKIKGNRTLRRWSEDTGLSTATLSNYINDKVRGTITPQTLRRMIAPQSNPRGNVTLEELYVAAGFEELKSSQEEIDNFLRQFEINEDDYEVVARKENNAVAKMMRILIESEVALSEGKYSILDDNRYSDRFDCITLVVNEKMRMKKQIIVIDSDRLPFVQMGLSATKLGRLLYIEPEDGLKVTLFTYDKVMFEQFKKERPRLSFAFDFSMILFDDDNISASEDLYLAYSDELELYNLFSDRT